MTKKIIILAGMLALAANAFAATTYTITASGNWNDISTLSNMTNDDRAILSASSQVSISTAIAKYSWLTAGSASSGTLNILSSGSYICASASNMTFGLGSGGVGILNLSGTFSTLGAIYVGQNGGTGTISVTGGTLTSSNSLWIGRSQGAVSGNGYFEMTSGTVSVSAVNVAYYSNATTSTMTGRMNLQGGTFYCSTFVLGQNISYANNAYLTVSSAMTQAKVGALTLSGTASLTLDAAASTNWTTKGAILAVTGALNVGSTSTIVLNLNDFDGWDGMKAGDKITMTLATYGSIVTTGTPSISAEGLSSDFTLGAFNLGATAATVDITYNPIPEPAMAAGLMGGAVLLLAIRRRRKD